MKRRSFLKTVGGVSGCLALGADKLIGAAESNDAVAGLPRRPLGRTGRQLSVVGFPGLALVHYDQERCDKGVRDAFDRGVNYFDVAPAYGDGVAETRMGVALQGLDRSRIFLACKTKKRDKDGARKELERSLERLKTSHFDLYQLHHLVRPSEVKQALGPGGAIETILKAKEEGKVKHIGFSAHTTSAAIEALNGFRFDSVMFPINFVEYNLWGFGKEVLELAEKQGVAVFAMKAMSLGAWPKDAKRTRNWWYRSVEEENEVNLAWRFALSRKNVVAGIPPSFLDLVDKAIAAARSFQPPTAAELEEMTRIAKGCESIFKEENARATAQVRFDSPVFPDSPHECDCIRYV